MSAYQQSAFAEKPRERQRAKAQAEDKVDLAGEVLAGRSAVRGCA